MTKLKTKPNGVYYLDTELPDPATGILRRTRVGLDTKDRDTAERQRADWLAGVHPKHPAMGGEVAPKGRAAVRDSATRTKIDTPLVSSWLATCLSDPEVWGQCRADLTARSNVKILSALLPSDLQIGHLSTQHIDDLVSVMRQTYAEGSIRKLIGSLLAAARYAVKRGHLTVIPSMPKVSRSIPRDRVLTLDEEVALLDCIRKRRASEGGAHWWHFEALVVLLLDTGIRVGEALQAGPSWVKRKRVMLQAGEVAEGVWLGIPATVDGKLATKSGKGRDIPLSDRALALVPQLNERQEGTKWFPWIKRSGSPIKMLAVIRADMAERGYDISDVVLHTMRHTCATRLAENGFDLVGLRDFLGHSDIKITAGTYLHLMNGHVWRAAAIINAIGSSSVENNPGDNSPNITMPDLLACGTDRADTGTVAVH